MEYILIENFNGVISIVTDENGEPLVFNSWKEADEERENCQNGIVVPLTNFMPLFGNALNYLNMAGTNEEDGYKRLCELTDALDSIVGTEYPEY